jgi:hypothetical protein
MRLQPSRRHVHRGDPLMAARAARPAMMNNSLAAVFGGYRRDGCRLIAFRTRCRCGILQIAWHGRFCGTRPAFPAPVDIAQNVDGAGLSHGDLPYCGGSTARLSAIGAWMQCR